MAEATWRLFGRTLRQRREAADFSQRRLAVQVPVSQANLSRYEAGLQAIDETMAARLDELLGTGGELARLAAQARARASGEADVLGEAFRGGAASALERVRWRLDAALAGPVTEDDMVEWERAADRYSRLVDRLPADHVLPGLLIDLDDARRHIDDAPGRSRPRVLRVCALLSALTAFSLVSAGDWSSAGRYWRLADKAARFSGDRSARCVIAGRRAVVDLYAPGGGPAAAVRMADEVLARFEGSVSPGTANALAARAQGVAMLGDRTEARAALADLEAVFGQLDDAVTAREAMWNWPESRLHHVRSFVYSHLGDMREAVEAQDRTLASYSRPFSQAAVQVHMHRAMSMIASGDPSQGARHVVAMLEALEPSFRPGLVGTTAEFALRTLPESAHELPEVALARELVAAGQSS